MFNDGFEANLKNWQHLMRRGNMCFDSCAFERAHDMYWQALNVAVTCYPDEENFTSSLFSVIISYHNLSETFARRGEAAQAEWSLIAADEFVGREINKFRGDKKIIYLLKAKNKTQNALHLHTKIHH